MTYVYDIVLNLTEYNYYDIYEWNNNDNYINIKKIPIFKVENNTLNNLINNKVKVTKDFLELINNKSIKNNNYSFISIFTNCEKSIGICFNSDGYIKYKSALMFNDEKTVNDIAKKEKIFKLKYRYFINKENNYLR